MTESWIVGGVMSQGSSASLSKAAHTTLAGTEKYKRKKYIKNQYFKFAMQIT